MIAFEKSVGAVVFRKEGDKIYYLLLDYGKMKKGRSHYWNFVKGHMEKGETEEKTMRREILEETGISKLKVICGFRHTDRYFYRAYGKEREKRKKSGRRTLIVKQAIYFLAEAKSRNVKISEEHINFKWLPFARARIQLTYKSSKKVLEKAKIFLEKSLSG